MPARSPFPVKALRWKFASVFGVALWFAGIGAMLSDKYIWAFIFYVVGAVWLLGWWLSEHPGPKVAGIVIIVAITAIMCAATVSAMRGAVRDDVARNLKLAMPVPNLNAIELTQFTVSNDSRSEIAQHSISCLANFLIDKASNPPVAVIEIAGRQETPSIPLQPGDAETSHCLAPFNLRFQCADVTVTLTYRIESQGATERRKQFRFVFDAATDNEHGGLFL
jgi:hypothetical protein